MKRKFQYQILVVLILFWSLQIYAQIQTNVPPLKDVYASDFKIGCLLSYRHVGFSTDPVVPGQSSVVDTNGGYLIKFHMNSMSPGNNMKPQYTVDITESAAAYISAPPSAKDSVDVHPVIRFNGDLIAQLNWAERQGFTFRGHTLVWHSQTPGTAFFRSGYTNSGERLTKEKMTERMNNYIGEVIRLVHENWPGLLSAFDIVNEAIDDNTGLVRTSGNEWFTTFGDSTYIMKAFEFARAHTVAYGETQMKLYYNDYNTHVSRKADGIVRLLEPIYQAGYLDGIGMQEHDNNNTPTAQEWINSYNKFATVCNEIAVTELDVATGSANPSSAVLITQANQYGQLFKCFVERSYYSGRGKVINVSKDGLNDTYTFQTNQSSSLWNGQNQCKPAFFSVVDVGNYYNGLDSLIAWTDTLTESNYTIDSWASLSAAITSATNSMSANYSANLSAADALEAAFINLQDAVEGLVIVTGIADSDNDLPKTFSLGQNYPNPFNPSTHIKYSIPASGFISFKVFNLLGKEAATIYEGFKSAGNYEITFNGSNLNSGVYFYRLQSNNFVETKKFILIK